MNENKNPKVPPQVSAWFSQIGAKGGKARSFVKVKAARQNAIRAREIRMARFKAKAEATAINPVNLYK